jgi:hypothetical protein
VHIHLTETEERTCVCGAAISEDERGTLCAKCLARMRWARRAAGRVRDGGQR